MTRSTRVKSRGSLYLPPLLCILLTSCLPGFKNPLPPPSELKADPHILGTWVSTTRDGSKQQLSVFQRSSGWVDVVFIYEIDGRLSTDGITVIILEGYSTSVDKQQFLCLRGRAKDSNRSEKEVIESGFWIFNYQILKKDELIVRPFTTKKVAELISKGKLKGEIVKGDILGRQPFDKVIVTSSSAEIAEAISREGVGAFIEQDPNDVFRDTNMVVFSRMSTKRADLERD